MPMATNEELRQNERAEKKTKIKRVIIGAFVGISLTAISAVGISEAWDKQVELDEERDKAIKSQYLPPEVIDPGLDKEFEIERERGGSPELVEVMKEGDIVEVRTDGYGLRIRSNPGLNTEVIKVADDGTRFEIIELAENKDGYRWVLLKEVDGDTVGYAATNWLDVID